MAAAWLASGYSAYQILPTLYNMLNAESKKEVVDYALNSCYGGYVLERIDDLCGAERCPLFVAPRQMSTHLCLQVEKL